MKYKLPLLLLLALTACGSAYKYYQIDITNECFESGKLLAAEAKDDLPLVVCRPDDVAVGKCVVLMTAEYRRLRERIVELEKRLADCEQGGTP